MLVYPVYHKPTMVPVGGKILAFRLSESLKMHSPGPFALPNHPQKAEFCIVFARTFLNIRMI